MKYFMIQRLRGEKVGYPIFFAYNLDKSSAGDNASESPYILYYTSYSHSPLIFLCKHTKINFDFYDLTGGEFFVSGSFAKLAQSVVTTDLKLISARLLSSKRKEISTKDYFIMRLNEMIDGVDKRKSVIEPSVTVANTMITKHLVIDPAAVGQRDLFLLKDRTLGRNLFCSEKFKELAVAQGILEKFIPEEDAAEEYAKTNPFGPK